jgi:hemolysin
MEQFHLSCHGRIAAALALSLVSAPQVWAEGITPATGAGVTVGTAQNGAAVVQIAPPSQAGLSHNRFDDYNVGKPGVVLNNSLNAGMSQLAGALPGNAALSDRAASVILNEVVSRNPSLLLGQQEIFGKAADFVLANPNGITCNGCGFINTPRASLLVGTPDIEAGRLTALSTAGSTAALAIGADGITAADALELVAPSIDARGRAVAASRIAAVSGQNVVDYAGQTVVRANSASGTQIDSVYLGGMQAGRISIVSTDQGAGVNLAGLIQADQGIEAKANGKLLLGAASLRGGDKVQLDGEDVVIQPLVVSREKETRRQNDSWFIWKIGEDKLTERVKTTDISLSALQGKEIELKARGQLQLSATQVEGGRITLQGGDVIVDGVDKIESKSSEQYAWKSSWRYSQYKEESTVTPLASNLRTDGDLLVRADRRVDLLGATLAAGGELKIRAGGDIKLAGLVKQTIHNDHGERYLDGPELNSGPWNNSWHKESLQGTTLKADGALKIRSREGELTILGSQIDSAGDMALAGSKGVNIAAQSTAATQVQFERTLSWGGIGGSNRQNDSKNDTVNLPSALQAGGRLAVRADGDIRISGSKVKGEQGAVAVTQGGEMHIEHVTDTMQSHIDTRRGGAFDIQTGRRLGDGESEVVKGAELASDTNLRLRSRGDFSVDGSQLTATGTLDIRAGGNVRIASAEERQRSSTQTSSVDVIGSAGRLDDGSGRYRAEAGIELTRKTEQSSADRQQGGTLSAGAVQVESDGRIDLQGARIAAQSGDVVLQANGIGIAAAEERTSSRSETEKNSLGVAVSGNTDGASVSIWQRNSNDRSANSATTPAGGQVQAAGNIGIDAGQGSLTTRGARVEAGNALSVAAANIDNQAAQTASTSQQTQVRVNSELSAGIELGGLLKPVENVVDKLKSGDLTGALADAGKIKDGVTAAAERIGKGDWSGALDLAQQVGTPAATVEITNTGQTKSNTQYSQTSDGSRFSGNEVNVHSAGALNDQGSHYEAKVGRVDIEAGSQRFEAGRTTSSTSSTQVDWRADAKAATTSGKDLALNLGGNGRSTSTQQSDDTVQPGTIQGAGGVKIDVANDASWQAARIDGAAGRADVRVGGNLQVGAAQTANQTDSLTVSGTADLDLNLLLKGKTAQPKGGNGSVTWDVANKNGSSTGWQGSQVSAADGVHLQTGGDLSLQASRLGSDSGQPRPADVSLQAGGAINLSEARSTQAQSSWSTSGDLSVKLSPRSKTDAPPPAGDDGQPAPTAAAVAGNLANAGLNVKVDVQRSSGSKVVGTSIDGARVGMESGGDTRLSGAQVSGEQVDTRVGGDLRITSVNDRSSSGALSVDVGLTSPDLGNAFKGDGETLRMRVNGNRDRLDAPAQQAGISGSERLDVQVAGTTTLEGGRLQSGAGGNLPAADRVTATDRSGSYSSDRAGADVPKGSLSTIGTSILKDSLSGKWPLGISHQTRREPRSMPSQIGKN